jgi:hypothetical protein
MMDARFPHQTLIEVHPVNGAVRTIPHDLEIPSVTLISVLIEMTGYIIPS